MKDEIRTACRDIPDGDINRMIRRGMSPFSLLVLGARTDSVRLIDHAVQAGADINGRDRESWTPLMHASYYNNRQAITRLLEHKARIHTRTDSGESAVAIAEKERNRPAVTLFNANLEKVRLRHAGILIDALSVLERERHKPRTHRDKTALALSCIDRGYVWWVGEEHPDKVLRLFRKGWELDPRVGAFPYASILAASGNHEKSLDILEMIQTRGWSTIPREGMIESGLFDSLETNPRWKKLLRRWPSKKKTAS